MTVQDIQQALKRLSGFYGVYVPEFSFHGRRIDAAIIDVDQRKVRGFEIKVTRADFFKDVKWHEYTEFTSSLSIACPADLIQSEEVASPFGLLYVLEGGGVKWEKKPKPFQHKRAMAWLYRYVEVIEAELPRLNHECRRLEDIVRVKKSWRCEDE